MNVQGRQSRATRSLFVGSIASLVVTVAAIFAQLHWHCSIEDEMRHVTLEYDVELSINGTGTVKVTLPVPVSERVFQDVRIQPGSSTYTMNRSDSETTLDIVMSVNTTFHAHLYALRSEVPVRLTKTTTQTFCRDHYDNCASEVGMAVLSGMVTDVHVVLNTDWSSYCSGGGNWALNCFAIPGRYECKGNWVVEAVC